MKAAVLYEARTPLIIKDLTQDPPQAGEVRVRIGAAGLCASDHHILQGTTNFPMPLVLGHEGAGTVEAVGQGVTSVQPGDRCILSFVPSCGQCSPCRRGEPQLCATHRATGSRQFDGSVRLHDETQTEIQQLSKLGVFAEQVVAPAQACHPIPDAVPMEVGALIGCCVTTGVGGVVAVDVHDHKLQFARGFGATDTVNARAVDPVAAVRELSGGGVDFAFDTVGGGDVASQALESVRTAGTAVIIGLAPVEDRATVDVASLTREQKRLVGSYYGSASPHQTFGMLVDLYLSDRLEVDGLITRRYALEAINEGFAALERGEDGRGVIVFE